MMEGKSIREKMRKLSYINWRETIRRAVKRTKEEEELRDRRIDFQERKEASKITDSVRRLSPQGWSTTEEIRKWRDRRKLS